MSLTVKSIKHLVLLKTPTAIDRRPLLHVDVHLLHLWVKVGSICNDHTVIGDYEHWHMSPDINVFMYTSTSVSWKMHICTVLHKCICMYFWFSGLTPFISLIVSITSDLTFHDSPFENLAAQTSYLHSHLTHLTCQLIRLKTSQRLT